MNRIGRSITLVAILCSSAAGGEPTNWKPAKGPLATRWAAQVDPRSVHAEYPRPQMVRADWMNLNGLWDYAIRPKDETQPATFDGQILVPFPAESALSGVMKPVKPGQRLWYRRSFELSNRKARERWLLHFGAVDWDATVFVNGEELGKHQGGFDPFTFDVTKSLQPEGDQEIVVSVWDPTDTGSQPRGKQVLKPGGIMYTANTGIWQTVWLERVPALHIESLEIVPDVDQSLVAVTTRVSGVKAQTQIVARVLDGDREVRQAVGRPGVPLYLSIRNPKLWSPDTPFLYGLRVSIDGDEVKSYFGMRKISVAKDDSGINRLFLNGKALFQVGPLDQGWWPDGLYTAPTDEALKYDLEITRKLGFNMIRKHVKVEPDRWYYWCDTMGILVWQDMPSGDNKDDAAKKQFALELERMIDAKRNHPSIVMWVPFNEGWGQHDTPRVVEWVKAHDPSRLVNNASGWTDTGCGDVSDMHNYPGPGMPPTEKARAAVLGEFGGLGLPLAGHLWVNNKNNWGYRTFTDPGGLYNAYADLISRLRSLEVMGLSAAVYTQTTDCEVEVNGLMTYDRAVIKLPLEPVAQAHKTLFWPLPTIKTLLPTAQTSPQLWSYTTHAPAVEWTRTDFDDSAWPTGDSGFGTKQTPGAIVHTEWKTSDIWLRRSFDRDSSPATSPRLFVHHDEDAEVFVNGKEVARLKGFTSAYQLVPLSPEAAGAFKPGKNVIAVHCHQTNGGQYIDVGVLEYTDPPGSGLPRARRAATLAP